MHLQTSNRKTAGLDTLTSDYETNDVTRDKEGRFMMAKEPIYQETIMPLVWMNLKPSHKGCEENSKKTESILKNYRQRCQFHSIEIYFFKNEAEN